MNNVSDFMQMIIKDSMRYRSEWIDFKKYKFVRISQTQIMNVFKNVRFKKVPKNYFNNSKKTNLMKISRIIMS